MSLHITDRTVDSLVKVSQEFSQDKKEGAGMTKTVCDICGKEMPLEIYVRPIKDYQFCISSYGKVWDICSECRNELDEWIKKRKAESEET